MARQSALPVGFEDLRGGDFKERYDIVELLGSTSRRVLFGGTDRQTGQAIVLRLSRPLRLHDEA
ncbi:MAG: hypothetical protein KDK70_12565, partial [Myxococcales bacterium]|nr:hypothetical protein [Myxococcales bacterium]